MKQPYITLVFFIVLAVSIAMMMSEGTSGWWFIGIVIGFYGFINYFIDFLRRNDNK